MTGRHILFGAVAASVAVTSAAAAGPAPTSVPPPVGRIAKELAGGGAKRVIVFASVGDKGYVATAGTRRPKADQRFRVGSVTKTFTATIVLQLVDEGKVGLSDTLEEHLPGAVPRGDEITIRRLLQHQSGLVNYTDFTPWLKGASRSPSTRPIDLLRFAGSKPLVFAPGTQWSYSNTNYIALGLVIEQVTGRSYAGELEQRLFQPLGLDATELPQTRLLPDLGDDDTASLLPVIRKGDPYYDVDWANPVVSWAAGGIVSNARDLARFYSALLSGGILSDVSLGRMKNTVAAGHEGGYGLGIASIGVRCGRKWGHGGGILDYGTLALASDKGERVGVISVYGAVSNTPPDESALVCQEYRLASSAATWRIAVVRERGGNTALSVVNADGSGPRRLSRGSAPAWSPDGRRIAFLSSGGVHVMNADGRAHQRVARGSTPAWSPDGRLIAFLRSGDIYVTNADGTRQRRLARGSAPAWSPDGRRIVFVREQGGDSEIYVTNADGSGLQNLTRNAADEDDPVWSPDGRRIAFARRIAFVGGVGGNFEIFVMNADGSGQRRLTHEASRDDAPAWSPDGRKIVFESRGVSGGGGHGWAWFVVAVVNADGSGQPKGLSGGEPLKDRAPRAALPAWSPDGRMIAYLGWRHGSYDVYVMNADGSGLTNVTRSRASESGFAWSPRQTKRS
jgi:D-alanyl-D-alanine carboxypeptidase